MHTPQLTTQLTRRRAPRAPVGLALAAAAALGCSGESPNDAAAALPSAEAGVPVRLASVVRSTVAEPVRATGVLAGREEMRLSFKVGGVIARVLVREGERVRAGQTLATLDPAEVDAQLARARTAAEQAERDRRRIEALYRDSVATLAQLEAASAGAAAAGADLRAVQFNRRFATITAPAAGLVLRRLAEPNEVVAPGAAVVEMRSASGGLVLRAGLADRDAVRVRPGARAVVRFDAYPGERFAGRVSELSAAAAQGTGTYAVEVAVDAGGRALGSGLVGAVEVEPVAGRSMALVPIEAVIEADGDSATVFTLAADGRRAERRLVTIAFVRDGRAAVAAGLDGASRVVTEGVAYLREGAPVTVVGDGPAKVDVAGPPNESAPSAGRQP